MEPNAVLLKLVGAGRAQFGLRRRLCDPGEEWLGQIANKKGHRKTAGVCPGGAGLGPSETQIPCQDGLKGHEPRCPLPLPTPPVSISRRLPSDTQQLALVCSGLFFYGVSLKISFEKCISTN